MPYSQLSNEFNRCNFYVWFPMAYSNPIALNYSLIRKRGKVLWTHLS